MCVWGGGVGGIVLVSKHRPCIQSLALGSGGRQEDGVSRIVTQW